MSVRVMQVMAGSVHGGAEAFFERLVLALHRTGLTQQIVIRRNPERAARLRAGGIEPVELPLGGRLDFSTRSGLRRAVAAFTPDVVVTWMSRATRFCPHGNFVHAARLGGYYNLKYYRRCDHLIGNTRDIVDYLVREGWPAERAHYLPNFVANVEAPPVPRGDQDTPDGVPLLLALGRLHRNKAFDVLIEALGQVPEAWLWLAGEGPLRAELEARAVDAGVAGRVRFLGWRDDVAALLAAADVLVCPSRHEPLGNVVLEAWARRKPVVAARSEGPGALIRDGETGLLVPVDDPATLAAALNRVILDRELAQRLAGNGRAVYKAEFAEEAVVRRYLGFFERVAR